MRILLQRVRHASVTVGGQVTGAIEQGLLLLIGFGMTDRTEALPSAVAKVLGLRVFENEAGKLDRSVEEINGGILLVPQFTLYGDARKGRRPDFSGALPPDQAEALFVRLVHEFQSTSQCKIAQGVFRAHMDVELLNDGPVTLMLEF